MQARRVWVTIGVLAVSLVMLVPVTGAAATQGFSGTVSATGTKWKYQSFQANQGDDIAVSLDWTTTSANLGLYLYKPDGSFAKTVTTSARPKSIDFPATATGTWKVGVKALSGSSAFDAGIDVTTPQPPPDDKTFTGSLDANGTKLAVGSFPVDTASSVTVTLDWDTPSANLTLFLKNPSGTQVASATGGAKPKTITYQAKTTGTWKINVKAASGAANYTATVHLDAATDAPAPVYAATIGNGKGQAEMYPSGLDVDPSGTMYIADTGNDQVAAYNQAGTQLWRTGERGPKADGVFQNPRDLAYLNGKLYVADTEQNRVQVLDAATGHFISKWDYRFGSLIGISAGVDAQGDPVILTSEDDRNTISEFSPDGTVVEQYSPTYGAGTNQLKAPRDAATDSAGNVYVADYANDRMVKLSPTLTWITSWGSKGSGDGQFGRPYGVAVDDANHVYVADSNNERIQEFDASGGWMNTMGSSGTGNGQFQQLRRVAVGAGASPQVYGADLWGNHVMRFSNAGAFQRMYGTTPAQDGGFNEPSGLAIGTTYTYVVDSVNQRIGRFVTSTGAFDLNIGHRGWESTDLDGFNWPRDVTLNNPVTNTLWTADTKNNRLTEQSTDGNPTGRKLGALGTGANQLHWPFAITSAGADLVVADTFNNRVIRWSPDAASSSWQTAAGLLKGPKDVAVSGNVVYVADTNQNRIVELNASTGAEITHFGALHNPQGVAVDGNGNIWVADTNWNRLVEYSPSGVFLQEFGSLGSGSNQFNNPTKLEVRGSTLYVADTGNNRVQEFTIG